MLKQNDVIFNMQDEPTAVKRIGDYNIAFLASSSGTTSQAPADYFDPIVTTTPLQTITVKKLAPTQTKGARIKATTISGESLVLPYDYNHSRIGNFNLACAALLQRLNWSHYRAIGGESKDHTITYVLLED